LRDGDRNIVVQDPSRQKVNRPPSQKTACFLGDGGRIAVNVDLCKNARPCLKQQMKTKGARGVTQLENPYLASRKP
jgi:hypothetical protein